MSGVTCQVSCVACQASIQFFFVIGGGDKVVELVLEGLLSMGPTLSSFKGIVFCFFFSNIFEHIYFHTHIHYIDVDHSV